LVLIQRWKRMVWTSRSNISKRKYYIYTWKWQCKEGSSMQSKPYDLKERGNELREDEEKSPETVEKDSNSENDDNNKETDAETENDYNNEESDAETEETENEDEGRNDLQNDVIGAKYLQGEKAYILWIMKYFCLKCQ